MLLRSKIFLHSKIYSNNNNLIMMKHFPTLRVESNPNQSLALKNSATVGLKDKDPKRFRDVVDFAKLSLPDTLGRVDEFEESMKRQNSNGSNTNNTEDLIQVKIIAGGTSNQLYHVFAPKYLNHNNNNQQQQQTSPTKGKASFINTNIITSPTNEEEIMMQREPSTNSISNNSTSNSPFECVVRVFGDAISQVVDRDAELFWQSRALTTFGKCQNGIAFEYLRGYKPLPDHSRKNRIQLHLPAITKELAMLHTLHLVDAKKRDELYGFVFNNNHLDGSPASPVSPNGSSGGGGGANGANRRTKRLADAMLTEWIDRAEDALPRVRMMKQTIKHSDTHHKNPTTTTHQEEAEDKQENHPNVITERSREQFLSSVISSGTLRREAQELINLIEDSKQHHITVPFCHNDSNPLNLMISDFDNLQRQEQESDNGGDHLKLIDFEYAGRNYVQFEIGTHWNEWSGLECDYSKFPNEQEQVEFLKLYLNAVRDQLSATPSSSTSKQTGKINSNTNTAKKITCLNCCNGNKQFDQDLTTCFCHLLMNNTKNNDEENAEQQNQNQNQNDKNFINANNFDHFRRTCLLQAQVAHVGWTAWSIFQAASSQIEGFDYIEYAQMRWNEYVKNKEAHNYGGGTTSHNNNATMMMMKENNNNNNEQEEEQEDQQQQQQQQQRSDRPGNIVSPTLTPSPVVMMSNNDKNNNKNDFESLSKNEMVFPTSVGK